MITALKEAPALEEIWVDALSLMSLMEDDHRPLLELLQMPALKKIHCLGKRFQGEMEHVIEELEFSEKMKKLIAFEDYAANGYVAHSLLVRFAKRLWVGQ